MSRQELGDTMGARPLKARWVIQGRLTVETALHLGGGGGGVVDMPILRDGGSGRPLLPGTTLAGALRSALADHLAGYGAEERAEVSVLFGGARGHDEGQSPLIVFDSLGELPQGAGMEIRDGVAIEPRTGTAEAHKKYDYEVLPPGTVFPVRVDLLLPCPDPRAGEPALLSLLAAALEAFSHGRNGLGARRSRGLGKVSAEWSAKRFALNSMRGWREWALSAHEPPTADRLAPIHEVLSAAAPPGCTVEHLGDARSFVSIELALRIAHDVLVRSDGNQPKPPDVSHLRSGGVPILPGTSLAGVMRAHALRIASVVRARHRDGECWVDQLFGPRFESQRPGPGFQPWTSRLRVGEAKIVASHPERQLRVAIDRFTQGAADTALFDEQTEVGGSASVRIELRTCNADELGLVLLVVKDLLDGRLPIGGSSSVGRGFLYGTATVCIRRSKEAARTAHLEPGKPPIGEAASEVDAAIRAFCEAKALNQARDALSESPAGGCP